MITLAAVADPPLAAKIFAGLCGVFLLIFGIVLIVCTDRVASFAREITRRTGGAPSEGFPAVRSVRRFGFVFVTVGALLVCFAMALIA
ncbi:hypothetical protein [Streptomyces sp. NPDC101132]|uniref:hypothetical protein n=1 Tax=Streptomyces sp. NPDC101132 TaxID=3366110 RepID=UPI0037F37FA9